MQNRQHIYAACEDIYVFFHAESMAFRNNKSVADSSIMLHAKMHKIHAALLLHHIREVIEVKISLCFSLIERLS